MASGINFVETVEKFLSAIRSIANDDCDKVIEETWNDCTGGDADKKSALDQAFRQFIAGKITDSCVVVGHQNEDGTDMEIVKNGDTSSEKITLFQNSLNMIILHAQQNKCTSYLPITLMSDIFDALTLTECEKLFNFVEDNVKIWTAEPFFKLGKNHLLRMCNDILRRLSKSLNTIFCGRIQLFLACLFPVEEKSALNIMSQFHTENLTVYKKNKEEFNMEALLDDNDTDIPEVASPIDFNLYYRFWFLQDFFRQPNQCFKPEGWKKFKNYVTEILNVFENYKIEYNEKKRSKGGSNAVDDVTFADIMSTSGNADYFPKYLTNEKLLDLQINDSNFRRYFLVQILILCQYLTGEVKFKTQANYKLLEKQSLWVHELVDRVYGIINDTPPKGKKFANVVRHVLTREENWISWKNEGCQSFAKAEQKLTAPKPQVREVMRGKRMVKTRGAKRSVGDEFLNNTKKKINLGTPELTKLWNLCPDNMEACKAESRLKFLPQLEPFFEEAVEQADPEAGIEDEYKIVNKPNFQWKALRLLARRSHHFFTPSTTPFKALPAYLTSVIEQLGKEFNKTAQNAVSLNETAETTVKQELTV
eukprot:TCONS_00072358-protein